MKKHLHGLIAIMMGSAAALGSPALAQTFPQAIDPAAAPGAAAFSRGTAGVGPFLDAVKDLPPHGAGGDSWWLTGYFTLQGQKIGYIYHLLLVAGPTGPALLQNISITNSTTGKYYADSQIYPLGAASVSSKELNIVTPTSSLKGSFDDMSVVANTPAGKLDLHLRAASPVMFNGGTGVFPFFGGLTKEYSVPLLATTGSVTIDNKTYAAQGASWFDRQWGEPKASDPSAAKPAQAPDMSMLKWVWFGINMSGGDALSVWSFGDPASGADQKFATVLHTDGSQTVAAAEITPVATKTWTSPATGKTYPVSWTIRIPELDDTRLTIEANPVNQEIVTPVFGGLYEGVSNVTGAYKGRPAAGVARLELMGSGWK